MSMAVIRTVSRSLRRSTTRLFSTDVAESFSEAGGFSLALSDEQQAFKELVR